MKILPGYDVKQYVRQNTTALLNCLPPELSGMNSSLGVDSVVSLDVSARGETGFTLPHSDVRKNNNEMLVL